LEKKHTEADSKRQQRQKELSESIQEKKDSIALQQTKLVEVEQKCAEVKANDTKRTEREVHVYLQTRSDLMNRMSEDIRKIVDEARAKTDNDSSSPSMQEIRSVWEIETNRIATQEKLCTSLRNELDNVTSTLENNIGNFTDEEKMKLDSQKAELERTLGNANAALEEAVNNKAENLAKYGQDYKNRYEFICWERNKVKTNATNKKAEIAVEKEKHQETLCEAEGVLDEVKTKYYEAVANENEKISVERIKVDERKKQSIKQSIIDQRECNEKVQQYRSLLAKRQEVIGMRKVEMEEIRKELTDAMKTKSDEAKTKAENLRMLLNDKIEDIHELERNHDIVKSEEEKVMQNMLRELSEKKSRNEAEARTSENVLQEMEQVSREKILLLKEDVEMAEKAVIQCRSDIQIEEEKIKAVDKLHENATTKLDTEVLYVGYLIDKEFSKDSDSPELATVLKSKQTLEELTESYKDKIELIKSETDSTWKPLLESREQVQVVLEDLVRTRGIAEVTLTELKEQFSQERRIELEEIEQLKERLEDLIEENELSRSSLEDEIVRDESKDELVSVNKRLLEDKQK